MVLAILNMEKQFVGKLENEILIDPIAVYREIWDIEVVFKGSMN